LISTSPIHHPPPLYVTLHLPYFDDEIFLTQETAPLMGYPPHERITPLVGEYLLSHWRYRIVTPDRGPYPEQTRPICRWVIPPFRSTFCKSNRTMTTRVTRYIYEGFFIWITPSTYQLHVVISPIALLRMKRFRYDFNFKCA